VGSEEALLAVKELVVTHLLMREVVMEKMLVSTQEPSVIESLQEALLPSEDYHQVVFN
jgi:hypothetical protein